MILIFFIALLLLTLTLVLATNEFFKEKKCINRVEYRYIPRTLSEEEEDPILATEIYKDIFEKLPPYY